MFAERHRRDTHDLELEAGRLRLAIRNALFLKGGTTAVRTYLRHSSFFPNHLQLNRRRLRFLSMPCPVRFFSVISSEFLSLPLLPVLMSIHGFTGVAQGREGREEKEGSSFWVLGPSAAAGAQFVKQPTSIRTYTATRAQHTVPVCMGVARGRGGGSGLTCAEKKMTPLY